jgi:hypothetical protein
MRDNHLMWMSRQGGAAGEPPALEQMEQWRRRMSPPDNEFPASVGLAVLLGRTGDTAVGITQVEAFSTGFRFTLTVRLRQAPPDLAPGGLLMLVSSHVHPGIEIPLEDRLLLGIEYADGQRASTLQHMGMPGAGAAADDARLVLVQQGGSSGGEVVDQGYWVAPLPPEGPVALVLAWPAFGMPESRTVVDGATIRTAAARSHVLWPPQPAMERPHPAPPPRPSTGWFAEPSG